VDALAWIGAVQGFIEDEDLGVVNESRSQAHTLSHAAGVGTHCPAGRVRQVHEADGPFDGGIEVGDAVQFRHHPDEIPAFQESVHGLVLGHDTDAPIEWRVVPDRLSEDRDRSARGGGQPGDHTQQCRLAGAIRPEQAGDAGRDLERHVADGDDAAEPARDAFHADHGARAVAHGVSRL
jgi:hypothetical protein